MGKSSNLAYSKGIVRQSSGECVKQRRGRSPCPKVRRLAKKKEDEQYEIRKNKNHEPSGHERRREK